MATDLLVNGGPSALERHMTSLLEQLTKDLVEGAAAATSGSTGWTIVRPPVVEVSLSGGPADAVPASGDPADAAPASGDPAGALQTSGDPSVEVAPSGGGSDKPADGAPCTTAASAAQCQAPTSEDAVDELLAILGSVTALGSTDWHELTGWRVHQALDVLEQLDRRLSGLRAGVLTTIEANGLWALDGQRTFNTWLKQRTDATPGAASRQVRHARALRDHLPLTREALEAGRISHEHVTILVRDALTTHRLRAQLSDDELGEAFLVKQAEEMDAGTFAKLVKHWAITADPEAADRAWRDAGTKEQFTVSRTIDGYHLAGWLDEVSGQVVDSALRSHMGRKAKGDERTPAQRRAAALTSLARQSLDAGLQGAHSRIRPHLTVTTSLETLRALAAATGSPAVPQCSDGTPHVPGAAFGFYADSTFTAPGGPREAGRQEDLFELSPEALRWFEQWKPGDDHVISAAIDPKAMVGVKPATLEDGTPIPPALLARLACESGLSRVVFGPDSMILDVGREQRIFPAHMVKAIIARDRHCQIPDCDEPPGFGEIHHSLQWYRDNGPTSVEHGLFACWHHHDWIHANGITIVRSKGRWYFYDRHGHLITGRHGDSKPA